MRGTENAAALLGRIAMSLLFIYAGWRKLLAPAATQAMLASHHLPIVKFGWIPSVVVELGGGLAVLLILSPDLHTGPGGSKTRHRYRRHVRKMTAHGESDRPSTSISASWVARHELAFDSSARFWAPAGVGHRSRQ
jgi:hypothetical protein